ncbi:MAG: undecaprenyl-diphosphate phosphatase [Burkholderiales bacterium]|jgi:undecaprenyl-diphosphatase|nr:undecaprenyl-diphosphate phosphatase [Burkholderiales bacterium]
MEWLQILALAAVQGFTEFLPISSSAHLILLSLLEGWVDQGLAFDVAVHVGSLVAVVAFFRCDLAVLLRDFGRSLAIRRSTGQSGLAWAVLWATVPVGLAGLLLKDAVATSFRAPLVIAGATIGFALLLWWADAKGRGMRDEHSIGWRDVLVIGIAQALALVPGTSRSGITMTAAMMLGLSRTAAARFSFLLSIPVITLAGGLQVFELVTTDAAVDWNALLLGCVASGLAAYLCIRLFLGLIERIGMLPFVIYRLLLGAVLFVLYA